MGKGKLRELLNEQKLKLKPKKSQKPREVVPEPESESESEAALESESESELSSDSEAELDSAEDEPQLDDSDSDSEPKVDASRPLSKKEQRKLKKLAKKAELASEFVDASDDLDFDKLANSDDDSEIDGKIYDEEAGKVEKDEESDDDEEAKEAEEDVPLSDAELDSDTDAVPFTKLTINNTVALKESLARIALPWRKHTFEESLALESSGAVQEGIKDIYDDTERELAFYKQALDAAKSGRKQLLKLKVPFSRPLDYFAEMVKSDEHMDRLKNKLLREAANKKASEDAKKQRQLKKYGKQVMHATLQDRAKQKRETLDKIKNLRKKRLANEVGDDEFQIALEEAAGDEKRHKPNGKRMAKNAKYGFGGKKRGLRKNDADSAADIYNQRKKSRPGKSKRK